MGLGLETLFHLIYELFHWAISWVFPQQGMIDRTERGVLVRGNFVKPLGPGPFWHFTRWSDVYVDNIVRKVREMLDQVLTTADGETVRAGGVLIFEIDDIQKWFIENEDAEHGLLVDAQRVLRDFVKSSSFEEIQDFEPDSLDECEEDDFDDPLTQRARKELGPVFGVNVRHLGLTVFAESEARDHNHTGSAFSISVRQ